jgi:hypothetical protein
VIAVCLTLVIVALVAYVSITHKDVPDREVAGGPTPPEAELA